jgi:hypothetical protein
MKRKRCIENRFIQLLLPFVPKNIAEEIESYVIYPLFTCFERVHRNIASVSSYNDLFAIQKRKWTPSKGIHYGLCTINTTDEIIRKDLLGRLSLRKAIFPIKWMDARTDYAYQIDDDDDFGPYLQNGQFEYHQEDTIREWVDYGD